MSDDIEKLLAKAAKALAAAKANAHNADTAANRAYYAMFNAIRAALATKGLRPKTHSSTISQLRSNTLLQAWSNDRFIAGLSMPNKPASRPTIGSTS